MLLFVIQLLLAAYGAIAVLLYLTICLEMDEDDGNFVMRQLKAAGISIMWLPAIVRLLWNSDSF